MEIEHCIQIFTVLCQVKVEIHIFTFISDNLPALFDMWIIGDNILRDLAQTYELIKTKAEKMKPANRPYLLRYYNVMTQYVQSSSIARLAPGRILNSLIDLINEKKRLPRFLIVIIDKDILNDVNVFDGYAMHIMSECV